MKVAFLSFYSGEVNRGVETYVHELANKLSQHGHQVLVVQNGPKKTGALYVTKVTDLSVEWKRKPGIVHFANYWSLRILRFTLLGLKHLDRDVDIVVATNGQWQSLLCRIWTTVHRKKLVIPGQSGIGFDDRFNLFCFPNTFVATTSKARTWARIVNPFIKSEYIPNGVDLTKFKPANKHSKKQSLEVLCVGAFTEHKQINLTIKAVSKIPNAHLTIVGNGPEEDQLKELAELLLPGRYVFRSVRHSDVPKLYQQADVFTFVPKSQESFGIVLVEALASGLPVVTTDDPQRREIVGDAGLFVKNPHDMDNYAKLLVEASKRDWGSKPRDQAQQFSWEKISGQYEQLFMKLLKYNK